MRSPRLVLPVLLAAVVGCGRGDLPTDGPPALVVATARYPVRSDLMLVAAADLGAPPKWPAAGYPPLRTARLGARSPDVEFAALLGPKVGKSILDPDAALPPAQRDDIRQVLDALFGTPTAPTVLVPGKDAVPGVAVKLEAKKVAEAAEAKAALGLDDAALARGGVLYRRWCLHCHGPTGAGDGAHAVRTGAMPRDYRRGVFKFVTCFPPGPPRQGELGKARKDDFKRTIRKGLEGSMMPPFAQFSDADLDDLAGYVMHLSVRGEVEFEAIARVIQLATNPRDDDPEYSREFAEQQAADKLAATLGNWKRAADSPIPVPPEHTPTEAARLASAARGYRAFAGTCAGCHQDYGRAEQLKFDLWGTVVQPRNLTLGVYRGGRRGEDLYARVYGGIYPSTMPDSKAKAVAPAPDQPDEVWDVVHFLQALGDSGGRKALQQYDTGIKLEP